MRPFAFSFQTPMDPIARDIAHRDALLMSDRAFFAERGIELDDYTEEAAALDTRTSYEKSTATPKGAPVTTDSDLDQHTKLDHPDKE
jgi:hypothetical protein